MKTDYTLTPEYEEANELRIRSSKWEKAYEEARKSHAAGEPLIRTVCKIATRILFVLLLVGIALGVMI